MCASANHSGRGRASSAGFSLIELMVSMAILTIVFGLYMGAYMEATTATTALTLQTEFRSKQTLLLNQITRDLHSTLSGGGSVSITANSVSFFPITGVSNTGVPIYANNTGVRTIYSWNPSLTTGGGNWADSTIRLSRFDMSGGARAVIGNVTNFRVTALGTTGLSNFSNRTPVTLRITIEQTRKKVFRRDAGNPEGRATVTGTADITVPAG